MSGEKRSGRPPRETPSPRQEQILAAIRRSLAERGYPPTLDEIGETVGLRARTSVVEQIQRLERMGYLRRQPYRARSFELTTKATSGDDEPPLGQVRHVPHLHALAGRDLFATSNTKDVLSLPQELVPRGRAFAITLSREQAETSDLQAEDVVVISCEATVARGDLVILTAEGEGGPAYELARLQRSATPPRRKRIVGKATALIRRL